MGRGDETDHEESLLAGSDGIDSAVAPKAEAVAKPAEPPVRSNARILLVSFCLMVVIGLANRLLNILQFQPMKNYPLFVNLMTTFAYLPTSLAYVLPMMKYRSDVITTEARAVPQKVWLVMGTLDSIAGVMQSLATAFLSNSGALVVLLMQSAIPSSMLITKLFLKTKYRAYQYMGAAAVIAGILIVLVPQLADGTGGGATTGIWSGVLVLSCIPMCLSSVYKEKALGDVEIDPVYLNYWVAVYQFIISFPLLIPTGYASGVAPADLPSNLIAGLKCYVGINTVVGGDNPDNCALGPVFVNTYILANLAYNVLIILLIKYGSSNILWLCLTLQVPVANLAFALPFMPGSKPVTWEDGVGLLVIMAGLVVYRFYGPITKMLQRLTAKRSPGAVTDAAVPSLDDGSVPSTEEGALLAVGADSPGNTLGGSTPLRGMHTHVTRATRNKGQAATAADKANALAAARQKLDAGAGASAPGRARGGSR